MTIWIDAQLSPVLGGWIAEQFGVDARHVRDLGLVPASDAQIFAAARAAASIVLTKDRDFVELVKRHGAPPQIIWITSGNTSNREMVRILTTTLRRALDLVAAGEAVSAALRRAR